MRKTVKRARRLLGDALRRGLESRGYLLQRASAEDLRYLKSAYDEREPLPPGAAEDLRPNHPRLLELQSRYAALDWPVRRHSRWRDERVRRYLDLRHFRGDTPVIWHYRELPSITALKYLLFLQDVRARDTLGLLGRLDEDGRFGCWTFDFEGYGRVSRDLLDSINEISFLQRHLDLAGRSTLRVLDIGAGYGRLAHRFCAALPQTAYTCTDAIPETTFLCEYYLRHRACAPSARVVPLDEIEKELQPDRFDLAVNVHSFPECTRDAVAWWIQRVRRARIPYFFIVPNDGRRLLTLEADGKRHDFLPLLNEAGYRQAACEPVIGDPAARPLLTDDHHHLFRLVE